MGWKSTINVTRSEAKRMICSFLHKLDETSVDDEVEHFLITDEQLGDALDGIYGDNHNLPHYGNNFTVISDEAELKEYKRLKEKFEG